MNEIPNYCDYIFNILFIKIPLESPVTVIIGLLLTGKVTNIEYRNIEKWGGV